MPSEIARRAKFIVTALVKPWDAVEQVGHDAIERVAAWFGPEERSRYERLVQRVETRLSRLPAHETSGAERLAQALATAETHLWQAGLTIDELIRRNLDEAAAVAEQKARFDRWPPGQGSDVGAICRDHVIPAVFEALFADDSALRDIDLAFKRAVLAKLEVIEGQGDIAGMLKALAAEALLAQPHASPWIASRHPPSALLLPERGIVGFARREQLEQELMAWSEAAPDIGVQLLFGPGGMGKTRFAQELCRSLNGRGWRAGFLQRRLADVPAWLVPRLHALPEPLLIVIDYAEDKPEEVARAFALATDRPPGRKLRLLMLARDAGDWWRRLPEVGQSVRDLWGGPAVRLPRRIEALAVSVADRLVEFERAKRSFAEHLPPAGQPVDAPDFGGNDFAAVLMIHMAALAAAEGRSIANADQLFEDRLAREAEIWTRGLKALDVDRSVDALRQGIALLTLAQGAADAAEAAAVLRRTPLLAGLTADLLHRVLGLVRQLYPAAGGDARWVEPLRPDLLGEEFVDRVLEWWPELLDVALDIARDQTLTVLGRLALRREQAGRLLSYERLRKLASALPMHTLALRDVAVLVLAQMHAWLLRSPQPWNEQVTSAVAQALNSLSSRLSDVGLREDALHAVEEAARLQRELPKEGSSAAIHRLATYLRNLAAMRSDMGLSEEALQAAEEAEAIARELVKNNSDAFTSELARCLAELAVTLNGVQRPEDAYRAAKEVVALYRKLARTDPDAYASELAMSLNNLTNTLAGLGRNEDAINAGKETVARYRDLARTQPDAFIPDLAMALTNLAIPLCALGRHKKALVAAEEAVALRRELVSAYPYAFAPKLAMSLNYLATALTGVGRREEALQAAEEAVAWLAPLFLAHPTAHASWMMIMTRTYLDLCQEVGREPHAGLLLPIVEMFERLKDRDK